MGLSLAPSFGFISDTNSEKVMVRAELMQEKNARY